MWEHGRCANGSSNCFCGANAKLVVAIVSSKDALNSPLLMGFAVLTDRFDAANLECGPRAARARYPSNGHFMSQMFSEAFRRETFRFQIGDRRQISIVNQHIMPFLFIHASGKSSPLLLAFGLGWLLPLLLGLGLRSWLQTWRRCRACGGA